MTEQNDRLDWFDQIIKDTKGMTQEERWSYYDAHPGSHEVVWKFRHKSLAGTEVNSFNEAVEKLGLKSEIEEIDKATDGLSADEYINWLDSHPSAKQTLVEINNLRDQQKK